MTRRLKSVPCHLYWNAGCISGDAFENQQGRAVQEGRISCPWSPGQHEKVDPLFAARPACQHPQFLSEYNRFSAQEIPQKNSWRHFRACK